MTWVVICGLRTRGEVRATSNSICKLSDKGLKTILLASPASCSSRLVMVMMLMVVVLLLLVVVVISSIPVVVPGGSRDGGAAADDGGVARMLYTAQRVDGGEQRALRLMI